MTRTPDEIKKGLHNCQSGIGCPDDCPYYSDCIVCNDAYIVEREALALIQQLQDDNAQLNRCIENMTDKLNAMNDEVAKLQAESERHRKSAIECCYKSKCSKEIKELETLCKRLMDEKKQLQAERDAAVEDLKACVTEAAQGDDFDCCFACKYNNEYGGCDRPHHTIEACGVEDFDNKWEWRGVQKEDAT